MPTLHIIIHVAKLAQTLEKLGTRNKMAMYVIWIIILCASSTSQGQISLSGSGEYPAPESGDVSVITHIKRLPVKVSRLVGYSRPV